MQYNASVSHKIPVFAIQFLQSNEVYLLVKPDMLCEAAQYIETGEYKSEGIFSGVSLSDYDDLVVNPEKIIKSSSKSREQFRMEYNKKFQKEKRSAT